MGGELTDLDEWTKSLLTNIELLNMDNNIFEKYQTYRDSEKIVWYGRSDEHEYYAIFNISDVSIELSNEEIDELNVPNSGYDIWQEKQINLLNAKSVEIDTHDVFLLKV